MAIEPRFPWKSEKDEGSGIGYDSKDKARGAIWLEFLNHHIQLYKITYRVSTAKWICARNLDTEFQSPSKLNYASARLGYTHSRIQASNTSFHWFYTLQPSLDSSNFSCVERPKPKRGSPFWEMSCAIPNCKPRAWLKKGVWSLEHAIWFVTFYTSENIDL